MHNIKYLVGALVVLLGVVLVLTFGKNNWQTESNVSGEQEQTIGDNEYQNQQYYYALTLPPKWSHVSVAANDQDTAMFNTSGEAMMSVVAIKQQGSLEAFLGLSDEEGGISIEKNSPVKVGGYDAVERQENWPEQGVQVIATYVKIQDMIYSFRLLPTGNKNSITNATLLREYRQLLTSFRLTDTSRLGKDWVSDASANWQIMYPQNWKVKKSEGEVRYYRDNYEIVITATTVSPSVCLFSDSPEVEGYAGNLRDKQYTELTTTEGLVMRRYFKSNAGDKSNLYFCAKAEGEEQFTSPTTYGAIAYSVPAKYDGDIINEMDAIIKTLEGVKNE